MNVQDRFWLNTAQAAEYGLCHVDTIRKALESGDLHGSQRKKNGRWLVQRECLDSWLGGNPCEHQRTARKASA
jgi:hypothetical protein